MSVNIHGKQYVTVSERVQEAHEANKKLSISTEVLPDGGRILIKATVVTEKGTFTGMSSANPAKMIEKLNPYEVAETSAIGRALGFAGYGVVDGIASADEVNKSNAENGDPKWINEPYGMSTKLAAEVDSKTCDVHDVPLLRGVSKTKTDEDGNPLAYWYHDGDEGRCFGHGYKGSN